jgi:hypothetical protein
MVKTSKKGKPMNITEKLSAIISKETPQKPTKVDKEALIKKGVIRY